MFGRELRSLGYLKSFHKRERRSHFQVHLSTLLELSLHLKKTLFHLIFVIVCCHFVMNLHIFKDVTQDDLTTATISLKKLYISCSMGVRDNPEKAIDIRS